MVGATVSGLSALVALLLGSAVLVLLGQRRYRGPSLTDASQAHQTTRALVAMGLQRYEATGSR